MHTIGALSSLALVWPVLCSAQRSTSVVATLQLPLEIFSTTPIPDLFYGNVSTSMGDSAIVTAYHISCEDFLLCRTTPGYDYMGFTVATHSTTYDLPNSGTIVCGITDNGPTFSGTALCTATAGTNGYYGTPGMSYVTLTESKSYVIQFPSMDEELAFSLGATTTTYSPDFTPAPEPVTTFPTAASSTNVAPPTSSSSHVASTATSSSSHAASTSTTTSAPLTLTSLSESTASTAQPTQTTGFHGFTEHEKIGVGVGIVAFVLVCCAAGSVLKSYRRKRRAANPNPPELYFNTDGRGQASGT